MTIGEKIMCLRTAAGMSQEQLADALEVSRQSVSKWEMDQSEPRIHKIRQMCTMFKVDANTLLDEEAEIPPASARAARAGVAFEGKYFGTDGFRGEANVRLTAQHAFQVGRFLGWYYANGISGCRERNYRPRVVIGKDTRLSSYMLEYAIAAGLTASGADAYILHVTTTPSVSYVTRNENFDCGVMISASHNAYMDNGIKLVNRMGEKLEESTLALIEAYLDGNMTMLGLDEDIPLAHQGNIGAIFDHVAGRNRYIGYLISIAAHSYRSLRIGLDCANGASWMIAPAVFEALGAKTYVINAQPDGRNINENSGSTHIERLSRFVCENNLDMGFAFDGDADRCIAVDEKGRELNGDHILYILANRLKMHGNLDHNTVVTTVMSNAGLFQALRNAGIDSIQTAVGDRFVHECMRENGYMLGGEQSGHIIMQKYATTGDGILTALMLVEEALDRKTSLSKLAAPVKILPQVLKNIRVTDKRETLSDAQVQKTAGEIRSVLNGKGRLLLRESGTEPVIRVMVEAENPDVCEEYVDQMLNCIRERGFEQK